MKPADKISMMQMQFREAGASEELIPKMVNFVLWCRKQGKEILITTVYRSPQEQQRLYAQGRTAPGNIVTNAQAGQSNHNKTINGKPASQAFDACPVFNGVPSWEKKDEALKTWDVMGDAANIAGLQWGRHWKKTGYDWSHFENTDIAEVANGKSN